MSEDGFKRFISMCRNALLIYQVETCVSIALSHTANCASVSECPMPWVRHGAFEIAQGGVDDMSHARLFSRLLGGQRGNTVGKWPARYPWVKFD